MSLGCRCTPSIRIDLDLVSFLPGFWNFLKSVKLEWLEVGIVGTRRKPMPVPECLTKRFKILLTKFCNRIASRLEFLNLSLHIPASSEMRDERQRAWRRRRQI
jgi:hypothetical protein